MKGVLDHVSLTGGVQQDRRVPKDVGLAKKMGRQSDVPSRSECWPEVAGRWRRSASTHLQAPQSASRVSSSDQANNEEQQHCTDGSDDDLRNNAASDMDPQTREYPTADQGANDANSNIGDDSETATSHYSACQPSCDKTH